MSTELSALDVSRWFLAWASDDEDPSDISNLKLQKLLYFAQGFSLARRSKPLFYGEIQAWAHGPVVPDVYRAYKNSGDKPIVFDDEFDFSSFPDDVNDLLASVWRTFGAFSAWRLREITHQEGPWRDCYDSSEMGTVIPIESMELYFKGLFQNRGEK